MLRDHHSHASVHKITPMQIVARRIAQGPWDGRAVRNHLGTCPSLQIIDLDHTLRSRHCQSFAIRQTEFKIDKIAKIAQWDDILNCCDAVSASTCSQPVASRLPTRSGSIAVTQSVWSCITHSHSPLATSCSHKRQL